MRMMHIGKSGIEASVVGLGAWAIGGDSNWGPSDDAESIRTIHRAAELGVTLLDTAPAYGLGHSEEVVGKALAGRRDKYVLASKCGLRWDIAEGGFHMARDGMTLRRNTTPARLAEEIEISLRRLKTDYLDLYLVHWQALPDFPCPIAETVEFLAKLKRQGKIRAIGACNLTREQFAEYAATGELDLIQEKYSMLDRGSEASFFELCAEHGVTFQAYSPLERGTLTGKITPETQVALTLAKSKVKWFQPENLAMIADLRRKWAPLLEKYRCTMAQLVIGWTTAQGSGSNVMALCGARKVGQIEENAASGDVSIAPEDLQTMREDVQAIS